MHYPSKFGEERSGITCVANRPEFDRETVPCMDFGPEPEARQQLLPAKMEFFDRFEAFQRSTAQTRLNAEKE